MTESVTPKVSRRWYKHPLIVVPCVLVLTISVAYGVLAWRYWSNPPKLSRNYAAEFNAKFHNVPEEQRAWPKYRNVIAELDKVWLKPWESDHRAALIEPEVAEFLQRIQPILEVAREAGRLLKLCYPLSDEPSKEDMILFPGRTYKEPSDNPELWSVSILPSRACKEMVMCLLGDALLASRNNDSNRATEDLLTVIAFAHQFLDLPFLATDLVSRKTYSQAIEVWGAILAGHPNFFSESQLSQLEAAARAFAAGDICVRLSGERMAFADVIQRNYADDGKGDGYFFPTSTLSDFGGGTRDYTLVLAAPFAIGNRTRFAGRRELLDAFNLTLDEGLSQVAEPFWMRAKTIPPGQRELQLEDRRYHLARLLIPNVPAVSQSVEETIQQRDAILLASAVVRFRQRTGVWPESIDKLTPDYIDVIPLDRFTGENLRYKLASDGPIIYSCGPDKTDNDGVAAVIPVEPPKVSFYRPLPMEPFNSGQDPVSELPPTPPTAEWRWEFGKDFDRRRGDFILWPPEATAKKREPSNKRVRVESPGPQQ